MLFERVFANARHQFTRTVTNALVEVGVQIATSTCFLVHSDDLWTDHKLLVEAIALSSFVVSVSDIVDGHRL